MKPSNGEMLTPPKTPDQLAEEASDKAFNSFNGFNSPAEQADSDATDSALAVKLLPDHTLIQSQRVKDALVQADKDLEDAKFAALKDDSNARRNGTVSDALATSTGGMVQSSWDALDAKPEHVGIRREAPHVDQVIDVDIRNQSTKVAQSEQLVDGHQ